MNLIKLEYTSWTLEVLIEAMLNGYCYCLQLEARALSDPVPGK